MEVLMRTTITIDDNLMSQLMQTTGESSPAKALRQAVQDYVRQARLKKLLALRGQVPIEDNWRELRQLDVMPLPTSDQARP
ncbi:type II toxin-antitoxin system VapB family antitoxin [Rhodoferax sp.]|uniref:type II toxin-antitoxin system VapB family antitoxin n=1 Tax=Rhodoferax sp. TaxID=50421 RepID=UPI0025CC2848|nr:type II toxin-antitoxin system VapB family antitoxin [Rhodoferax sp.]